MNIYKWNAVTYCKLLYQMERHQEQLDSMRHHSNDPLPDQLLG